MQKICARAGCGSSFQAGRVDARYCSNGCRARASKAKRRGSDLSYSKPPLLPERSPLVQPQVDERAHTSPPAPQPSASNEVVEELRRELHHWRRLRPQLETLLATPPGELESRQERLEWNIEELRGELQSWRRLRPQVESMVSAPRPASGVTLEALRELVRKEVSLAVQSLRERMEREEQGSSVQRQGLKQLEADVAAALERRFQAHVEEEVEVLRPMKHRLEEVEECLGAVVRAMGRV